MLIKVFMKASLFKQNFLHLLLRKYLVHLSTMSVQLSEMTQHLEQNSLCSLDMCFAKDLPRLKMLAAAGCRLLPRTTHDRMDLNCPTSVVAVIADATTVVARSLKSMLKLSFPEEKLIGACSLLTSMGDLARPLGQRRDLLAK